MRNQKKNLNDDIDLIIEKINASEEIYLISHINPDGDSLGSLLALGEALKQLDSSVTMVASDDIPDRYSFLSNISEIEKLDEIKPVELLITLDCGDQDRLGEFKELANKAKTVINIDHHISNNYFGDLNLVNSDASSTGEMIYDLIEKMNLKFNDKINNSIYMAISTDTGSFKYSNTSYHTHEIASNLLKKGIDNEYINNKLYQNNPLSKAKLFIETLKNLELYNNNSIGIIYITQTMIKRCGAKIEHMDGIINFVRDIDTVEVACILKEINNNKVKIGLRSKEYVDVSKIAKNLNGGGHKKASGATFLGTIDEARDKILSEIQNYIR